MTNFMKTTTTSKVDMIAIFNYISHELHRLVSQGSDVSFQVKHYIPDEPDLHIRGRYELKSSYRKDLVKSLSDGAEFFKSLGK